MLHRASSRALLAASSLWLSASAAHGQPRAPWTERAVVSRAIEHSPEVSRARTALYEASALRAFSTLPRVGNPTVNVRAMFGYPDAQAATYSVLVGVPVDVSGARGRWGDEARWAVREAEARVDVARNEASAQAREAWVDAAVAAEAIAIAEQRSQTARALQSATQTRLNAQSATALDLALAERESSDAELSLVAARRERESALARLREALALAPAELVDTAPIDAPSMPVGLSRERAAALAIAQRQELAALQFSSQRARSAQSRLHHEATAPVLFAGEFEWQSYAQSSFGVSAQWALPIALTNQGERGVAEAQARAADEQRTIQENVAANEAAAAWAALELRLSELAVLDRQAIPAAERVLSLTEALFRASTVDLYRLLRARDELYALRSRRLEALSAAHKARIQLDRTIATPRQS
jgi:outer membrane protein TolC